MKQFYLRYTQDSEKSDTPFAVTIGLSLNPIHDRASIPDHSFDFQDRIYFERVTPLQALEDLEKKIADFEVKNNL